MKKLFLSFCFAPFFLNAHAQQWDTLNTGTQSYFTSCNFSSPDTGIVAGYDPNQYESTYWGYAATAQRTTDGGMTWNPVTFASGTSPQINKLFFLSAQNGWAACNNGYILKTTDGGQSFSTAFVLGGTDSTLRKNVFALDFLSASTGYIAGQNGMMVRTTDGGSTWTTLNSGTSLSIRELFFLSAAKGWATGDGGYLAMTTDSGNTWTPLANPYYGFFDGYSITPTVSGAVAVGNYGFAISSPSPDTLWSEISTGTNKQLNCVRFVNAASGLICGNGGTLYQTLDSGMTWVQQTSGVTDDLNSISFGGDSTAYICGANGRVLKSHNDISGLPDPAFDRVEVNAFPNPFTNQLNIVIGLQKNSPVIISVMDISGRVVADENEGTLSTGRHILQPGISSLTSGIYFVNIISGEQATTVKVVKQ